MINPFETIHEKLTAIENLLLNIQQQKQKPMNGNDSDEILTIQQASAFINLALPTIYALVSKREIPHSKRGKKLYFSKKELTIWIQSGKRKTADDLKNQAEEMLTSQQRKKAC
jgi:excisionase family DNA binding protein